MKLLTTQEVAEILRMSEGNLRQLQRTGDGPPFIQAKKGGAILYDEQELKSWLKENQRTRVRA